MRQGASERVQCAREVKLWRAFRRSLCIFYAILGFKVDRNFIHMAIVARHKETGTPEDRIASRAWATQGRVHDGRPPPGLEIEFGGGHTALEGSFAVGGW